MTQDTLSTRAAHRLSTIAVPLGLVGAGHALTNVASLELAALFVLGTIACLVGRAYLDGLIDAEQFLSPPSELYRHYRPSRSTTRAVTLALIMVVSLPAMAGVGAMDFNDDEKFDKQDLDSSEILTADG